ncbi:hypothetical protein EON79_01560 [bacterium]|nr:MAG: hypothetical protein EON79_01560 [bacterium]
MRAPALLLGALLVASVSAQAPQSEDAKRLAKLEKNYVATKAALAKKPKDKKTREAFVTAGTLFGHESMISPELSAKIKYRQALKVYREVLKIDPKQPVARKEYDLIVSIYKQMGRPVPQ